MRSRFLLSIGDRFSEGVDRWHIMRIASLLRHVPPRRTGVQRITHTTLVDRKNIFLPADFRLRVRRLILSIRSVRDAVCNLLGIEFIAGKHRDWKY
jgi:hypothetical protein